MKKIFLAISVFLFLTTAARAEEYQIDAAHSQAGFKIRHLVAKTSGVFSQFQGSIELNEADITQSSVKAVLQTASIDTNNADRDNHLRGADFFDAEKYPEITFVSKKVEADKITGDLTMHGVTKEVVLDYQFSGTGMDPWGNKRAGFSATTKIKRADFGINFNKTLDQGGVMLGEEVEISLEIEAMMPKPAA